MHWLHIDVSDLAGKPGSSRILSAEGSVQGMVSGLGRVDEVEPVHVDLTLTSSENGIGVGGRAWGRFQLSCSRCLIEYGEDFGVDLDEMFYFEPQLAEEKDGYEVKDQTVDLEPMLRDAIVLNIPIKPVHAEDCRGLCAVCGADLNVTDCKHGDEPVDVRWERLKDLIAEEP
jgi:DUF177 domain-containing protein